MTNGPEGEYLTDRLTDEACKIIRANAAAHTPFMLVTSASLPVKNTEEFIAYAKARPGQLNYATSGNGTIVHLTSEAFKAQAGLFIVHIPYRGTALAIPDLVSGKVQLLFDSVVSGLPHVRDGKLKALAVTTARRSPGRAAPRCRRRSRPADEEEREEQCAVAVAADA
jgi:tripartite-type tricarboxylate transporter receptor subunit TctC